MKKNLPKTKRRGKRNAGHMSCLNEGSYGKCVAARDSGVLQVCHFGASPQHEPKLLTSCLWWSSQLQSFPGASRLLDPVQCFSVMKITINSPCSFWVCMCNQCNWTGAASPGCHCLSPCLLHPCGLGKLQCIASCYICPSGRWKMFIWMVFPNSIGLWGELIVRGNLWILGGLESRAAVMVCCALLPCFSGWGDSGRIIYIYKYIYTHTQDCMAMLAGG